MSPSTELDEDMGRGCPSRIHRDPLPPPPFRFLALPGEIQNQIANYFIVSETPITIREPRFNRHQSPPRRPPSHPRYDRPVILTPPPSRSPSKEGRCDFGHTRLALMLACRNLYREHWRTYYGDNLFEFNFDVFARFLRDIPARCVAQIRRLRMRMPHRQYHERLWKMFSSMQRLEELELCFKQQAMSDETVKYCCLQGIRECARLKLVRLRRDIDTTEEGANREFLAEDNELDLSIPNSEKWDAEAATCQPGDLLSTISIVD